MTIGPYEVHALETGNFALDGGAMFGVVPRTLWAKSNPPDEKNRITLAARVLLLVGGGRRILVDAGNGSKFNEKFTAIYRIDSSRTSLPGSLQRHGLSPTDITDVVLTHLHFDHAGGSTMRVDGRVVPTFPRARYYVQRAHWEAALHPTERDHASFFPEDFVPLRESGLLEFTDGEGEVIPGIRVRVLNGHTTALQSPIISDGRTTLFYCADLFPTTSHLPLPWIMAYDLRPLVTLEEKRRTLKDAVENGWIFFYEHDPVTAAARLRRDDKGISLGEPVAMD